MSTTPKTAPLCPVDGEALRPHCVHAQCEYNAHGCQLSKNTAPTPNFGRIAANVRTVESLPDDARPWSAILAMDLRTLLTSYAAKERECEELKEERRDLLDGMEQLKAKLTAMTVSREGYRHDAMAAVELATTNRLRAEKAEARVKELESACRRQVENIERWLATGEPAGPEESKSIYDQLKAALRAAGE